MANQTKAPEKNQEQHDQQDTSKVESAVKDAYSHLSKDGAAAIRKIVPLAKQSGNLTRNICLNYSAFIVAEFAAIPRDVSVSEEEVDRRMKASFRWGTNALRQDAILRFDTEPQALTPISGACNKVRKVFETDRGIFEVEENSEPLTGPGLVALWAEGEYVMNLSRAYNIARDASKQSKPTKTLQELLDSGTFNKRRETLLAKDPARLASELDGAIQFLRAMLATARERVADLEQRRAKAEQEQEQEQEQKTA